MARETERDEQFFRRQVCVGWWLPVLLLLYTLAGKPPLTSAVIFQKVACKFAFYAIALMQHVTSCNPSPDVGGPVSRVIAQEQKGGVGILGDHRWGGAWIRRA